MTSYQCSQCGQARPLECFYKYSNGRVNPWCKECYRKWYRARRTPLNTAIEVGDVRNCEHCGARFALKVRAEARFCSRVCGEKARTVRWRIALIASKSPRSCLHCGGTIGAERRSDARYCSEQCNSAAHQVTRKMAKRAGTDRPADLLSRAYITKRDGWKCGICGGRVNKSLRHPDPMCASIDHIIPLAAGGTNDLTNLQLAHLRCNLSKRQYGGGQLRLIG